jgi:hypothetical protein
VAKYRTWNIDFPQQLIGRVQVLRNAPLESVGRTGEEVFELVLQLHGANPCRLAAPKLPLEVEARRREERVASAKVGGGMGGGEGERLNAAAGLHHPWRALLVARRRLGLQLVGGLDAGVRAVVHDVEEQRVGVGALHLLGGGTAPSVPVRAPEVGPATMEARVSHSNPIPPPN